ncbi:hypothetical protein M758_UG221100 [Ceratodon purpureus]|nr:hypothetical protein M758_UG221100 [Ceratodon purpureus]
MEDWVEADLNTNTTQLFQTFLLRSESPSVLLSTHHVCSLSKLSCDPFPTSSSLSKCVHLLSVYLRDLYNPTHCCHTHRAASYLPTAPSPQNSKLTERSPSPLPSSAR